MDGFLAQRGSIGHDGGGSCDRRSGTIRISRRSSRIIHPAADSVQFDIYVPPPGHPLSGCVELVFRVRSRGDYAAQTILPAGTASILFNLGSRVDVSLLNGGHQSIAAGTPVVGGLPTVAYTARQADDVYIVGVSLKAAACSAVYRPPMDELTDVSVEGDVVYPELRLMCERLYHAAGFAEQRRMLLEWVAGVMRRRDGAAVVRQACRALAGAGEPRVGRVARELAVSERHLRRVFLEHVGLTPAQWRKLARFSNAVGRMAGPQTLTEVAHGAGYADQAHFCRDFADIAGMTPGEYRQRVGPIPGHVFSP